MYIHIQDTLSNYLIYTLYVKKDATMAAQWGCEHLWPALKLLERNTLTSQLLFHSKPGVLSSAHN